MKGLDLSKSMDNSSKLTGQKAKYTGADVAGWVDVVMGACKSPSDCFSFLRKTESQVISWELKY